jgi:hypothetical protein
MVVEGCRVGAPGRSVVRTVDWLTVEAFDGATPAAAWARAWQDLLTEAALARGAVFWDEHEHRWGVVLEFAFDDERRRDAFRQSPVLLAALDAAPDPVHGLAVYPHRGGGAGSRQPRRPRPVRGAAALPEPDPAADRILPCSAAADPGAVATAG